MPRWTSRASVPGHTLEIETGYTAELAYRVNIECSCGWGYVTELPYGPEAIESLITEIPTHLAEAARDDTP
jgi:hypothetical protein